MLRLHVIIILVNIRLNIYTSFLQAHPTLFSMTKESYLYNENLDKNMNLGTFP